MYEVPSTKYNVYRSYSSRIQVQMRIPTSLFNIQHSAFDISKIVPSTKYHVPRRLSSRIPVLLRIPTSSFSTQRSAFDISLNSLLRISYFILGTWYLVLSTILYHIVALPPNNRMLTINSCVWFGSR